MNAKNNRRNTNFQILHFMVGHCHTVDGAYALLCELRQERRQALGQADAAQLRTEARVKHLKRDAEAADKDVSVEARAQLMELAANREVVTSCYDAAVSELAFIEECMEKLEPHRAFKHLTLPEAHEAAQRGEWRGELLRRAENFLLVTGTIPADEFNTMRSHPDFKEAILPRILQLQTLAKTTDGAQRLLSAIEPATDAEGLVRQLQAGMPLLEQKGEGR